MIPGQVASRDAMLTPVREQVLQFGAKVWRVSYLDRAATTSKRSCILIAAANQAAAIGLTRRLIPLAAGITVGRYLGGSTLRPAPSRRG